MMKIFEETKKLVANEKFYTSKILQNLMIIEKDKLYCQIKYSSLHHYLTSDLKYSKPEATLRVNAVRLMLKSALAKKQILSGKLSLTNASMVNQSLLSVKDAKQPLIEEMVKVATYNSSRDLKMYLDQKCRRLRREVVVLEERTLDKFDRVKNKYARKELSSYEVIQVMLERELKSPLPTQSVTQSVGLRNPKSLTRVISSRYIPMAIKSQVNNGKCKNCGKLFDLEFDHIKKYSHGGLTSAENLQMLCRSCNLRKEIEARQSGFFA